MRLFGVVCGVSLLCVILAQPSRASVPGDVNCDGHVGSDDLIAVTFALFGDQLSVPICEAPDANADGRVNAADVVAVLRALQATNKHVRS